MRTVDEECRRLISTMNGGRLNVTAWEETTTPGRPSRYVRVRNDDSPMFGFEVMMSGLLVTTVTVQATVVIQAPAPSSGRDDCLRLMSGQFGRLSAADFVDEMMLWAKASSVPTHSFDDHRFVDLFESLARRKFDAGELGDDPDIVARVVGQATAHSSSVEEAVDFGEYAMFPYSTPDGIDEWVPRIPSSQIRSMESVDDRFSSTVMSAAVVMSLAGQVFGRDVTL